MDVFNSDIWKQQWADFMNYPYIMATGVAITTVVVWWFRGFQIKIFKDRLQFADERAVGANEAKDEVIRKFNDLKAETAKAGNDTIAARVANVEAAIEKLSAANNAVRFAIGIVGTLAATESSDSLPNPPLALQAEADKERAK